MGRKKRNGFSFIETLIVLSIIGILCSTTLAVNSMDINSCKTAEIKVEQTNKALSAWNKSFTKNDETAVGGAFSFTAEDALINSLREYLDVKEIRDSNADEVLIDIDGYKFKGYKKLILSNGAILNVKHIYRERAAVKFDEKIYNSNKFTAFYAYITVNVPHKNKTRITNVYILKYNGLKDIGYIDPVCEI